MMTTTRRKVMTANVLRAQRQGYANKTPSRFWTKKNNAVRYRLRINGREEMKRIRKRMFASSAWSRELADAAGDWDAKARRTMNRFHLERQIRTGKSKLRTIKFFDYPDYAMDVTRALLQLDTHIYNSMCDSRFHSKNMTHFVMMIVSPAYFRAMSNDAKPII